MSTWRPSASSQQLRFRAQVVSTIRAFMAERRIMEVATPVQTAAGVTEPQIQSLPLGNGGGFLRSSPEYFHKRLLAAGSGDVYEIGPVFRSGERGRLHRPEFTLLEWYRIGQSWRDLADETVTLIQACSPPAKTGWTVRYASWSACFSDRLGFDPLIDSQAAQSLTETELPSDCDVSMRLDYLFAQKIQTAFPPGQLTVVHGYPADQAALAMLDPEDPSRACRFEVFAGPLELANGYQELTDASEQRARFEQDNRRRDQLGLPAMPIDEALLDAMAAGLPPCSGVALGLERLLLALSDADDISAVMAFG